MTISNLNATRARLIIAINKMETFKTIKIVQTIKIIKIKIVQTIKVVKIIKAIKGIKALIAIEIVKTIRIMEIIKETHLPLKIKTAAIPHAIIDKTMKIAHLSMQKNINLRINMGRHNSMFKHSSMESIITTIRIAIKITTALIKINKPTMDKGHKGTSLIKTDGNSLIWGHNLISRETIFLLKTTEVDNQDPSPVSIIAEGKTTSKCRTKPITPKIN